MVLGVILGMHVGQVRVWLWRWVRMERGGFHGILIKVDLSVSNGFHG